MAKGSKSRDGENMPAGSVRMGDIKTAASSTMEPRDFKEGYPRQPGALENKNFGDHKRTKG